MAPNVTLHFFSANAINAEPIAELTDESPYFKGLKLKMERDGLGGAELVLQRAIDLTAIDAGAFNAEVFVRVILHAYSDTVYFPWGWFLSKRDLDVVHVDEDGGEEYHLGGPGPKQYLSRGILGIGSPNTGWNLDLANGVWRWGDSATVGRILGRTIGQDAHEDDPAFPNLTRNFDDDTDSAGVAWADDDISGAAEQYRIPIGTSLLQILWDLDDIVELSSWVNLGSVGAPEFQLNVIQGLGEDYTGTAFGSSVCLLKEGVNIANDALTVEGVSLKKASHVVVEGLDGKWAEAVRPSFTPGDYVKRVKIEYRRTKTPSWLEKAGLRWLKRQDYGENALSMEILPGADDEVGLYFPAPDRVLWLSNLISLDTSADGTTDGHFDYDPADPQLVTGFEITLGNAGDTTDATAKARSWNVKVNLNVERPGNVQAAPNQNSAGNNGGGGGGGGGHPIELCDPATPGIDPVSEVATLITNNTADAGGDAINWDGVLANQPAHDGANGYWHSSTPKQYSTSRALPGPVGSLVRFKVWGYDSDGGRTLRVVWRSDAVGADGNQATTNAIRTDTIWSGPTSGTWSEVTTDVRVPTGATSYSIGHGLPSSPNFDTLRVYLVDPEGVEGTEGDPGDCPEDVALDCAPGTGAKAARCDHVHAHGNLSDDEAHHHNLADIQGGAGSAVPDLLNSVKASADTPDDDFDGTSLDGKWTVVDGSSGTVSLLAGSGAGVYQVGARDGWISFQLGTANGDSVQLRQDYTLPDGKCLVAAMTYAEDAGSASVQNNEIILGIGVNDNDAGITSGATGQTAHVIVDTEASSWRIIGFDGSGSTFGPGVGGSNAHAADMFYLRVDRSGLNYDCFASNNGFSWTYIGRKTMSTAANNVWLFATCQATMSQRIVVGCPWIRQGTALAIDPWPL